MKKFVLEFVHRGFSATGLGPIVLAIVYLILQQSAAIHTLTVDQVCIGIFSLSALAFIAGGMNAIYQIERLPLMTAILIHGSILYVGYLGTYLLNGWLDFGVIPIIVFTAIFVVGYIVIWAVIYSIIKRNTARLNEMLKKSAERAGIDKNVHNHSFRHMFATCLLDNSVPIEQIQLCMGHSDISVTTRYARIRNERDVIRNVMDMEVF